MAANIGIHKGKFIYYKVMWSSGEYILKKVDVSVVKTLLAMR
jgi:hypothetical protein